MKNVTYQKIVLHTMSKNLSFLLKFCDRSQAKRKGEKLENYSRNYYACGVVA